MPQWGGLWDNEHGATHSLLINQSSLRKRLSLIFRQRGNTVLKELMLTLNGAVAGSTAQATHTRVQSKDGLNNDLGGKVTIETANRINRVTTAADKTDIDSILTETRIPTYPVEKSGNSGGGKLGF